MTIQLTKALADQLGFDLAEAVEAFRSALAAHAESEGEPAPVAHPIVETIVRSGQSFEIVEPPEPELPNVVPDITRRQLRLWLVRNGVALASVEAAIDAMPEPARTEAQIEWQDASVYKLSNPLVIQIGAAVGLSDPDVLKQAFRDAALI